VISNFTINPGDEISPTTRKVNSSGYERFVPYLGARTKINTMVNGADTLSTVTAIDSNSMRFDWKAFH